MNWTIIETFSQAREALLVGPAEFEAPTPWANWHLRYKEIARGKVQSNLALGGPEMMPLRRTAALAVLVVFIPFALTGASREPVRSKKGMVVSASPIASEVGAKILGRGGNAVDAAVAVAFALAVTYPTAGNIGGGGFMVIHDATTGKDVAIDYREKAPTRVERDMYLDKDGDVVAGLSTKGHLGVAVPGTTAGLLLALERYGTLGRATVMAPAIRLAAEGFPVSFQLSQSLGRAVERLGRHAESRRIFLRNGHPFEEGEILTQPELAATLIRIAAEGRDGFYDGETARLLVDEMRRGGGLISLEDLKAYQAVERAPVRGNYRGYEIVSMPPPSSGGTVLIEMLNMIEMTDVTSLGHHSSAYVHVVAEAMKRAFADRARYMGDPDFGVVPVAGLTSKEYARERWASFDEDETTPARELAEADPFGFESEETTHFSVVDANGSAVSNTYTLNFGYGSGVTVRGAGFLLNNIMDNFTSKQGVPNAYGLIQGEANAIAPGKRPLSSMTPSIVLEEGEVRLVTGTPGGPTIINTVLQTILNVIDFGFDVQEAVDGPRFHHQWFPDRIDYEKRALVSDVLDALASKGHATNERGLIGDAQAIYVDPDTGMRTGGSDPRRGGAAVGQKDARE